jgi:anaerobic selenocysteine-containing dehydrogenase
MKGSGLSAVPVTRLYDRGTVIAQSNTLAQRLAERHFSVNPEDAQVHGLKDGEKARVEVNGRGADLAVRISEDVPAGFLLVPRSLGLDLDGPEEAAVLAKEKIRQ